MRHNLISDKRKTILFGAGAGLDQILNVSINFLLEDIKYIVDNDQGKWGENPFGIPVFPPTKLLEEQKEDVFILITSVHTEEITNQLQGMGFKEDIHFRKIYNWHLSNDTRLNPNREILVTMHEGKKSIKGGAIFKINLKDDQIHKFLPGIPYGGICHNGDGYAVLSVNSIHILDNQLNRVSSRQYSDEDLDFHGIAYADGYYYIVETATNTLKIIDKNTLQVEKEVNFTTDFGDKHHINDIFIHDGKILLSMLTKQGLPKNKRWNSDDGAIVALDKTTLEIKDFLITGLQYPHSVKVYNDEVYFCESRTGKLSNTKRTLTAFNGFTRGLAFDGNLFFVGQSKYRGPLSTSGMSYSLDGGIHVYDPLANVSRFIKLGDYSYVYDILVI